jgi:hypothetical protein
MNKSTPISQLPPQQSINDDDVVVQDILNQINGEGPQPPSEEYSQQPVYYPPPMPPPPPQQQMVVPQQPQQPQGQDLQNYLVYFADDLKLGGLVFTVAVLVHFIPIDKYVSKYFNVQNIPYHDVILRAILIALIVVLLKKFAKI